jgi:hypothetical protein
MISYQAKRMVGGSKNTIVEWHTKTCHHCGVYGIPANNHCKECNISAHDQCITFNDGLCDMCQLNVSQMTPCILCGQSDPVNLRDDSTDRLLKKVVCFGRTWTNATNDSYDIEQSHVQQRLEAQGYIFVNGVFEEHVIYDPRTLPHAGKDKMFARSKNGDTFIVSDPLVVHTWCALCLFQVSPSLEHEWKDTILNELRSPTKLPFGSSMNPTKRATFQTHKCVFCNEQEGWTTFCFYHMSKKAGCTVCRDGPDLPARWKTLHAFHPSCAVWYGMQRIMRKEGCGMLCFRNKVFRAQHMRRLEPWLEFPSGINECLPGILELEGTDLIPEDGVTFKGDRFAIIESSVMHSNKKARS